MMTEKHSHELLIGIVASSIAALALYFLLPSKSSGGQTVVEEQATPAVLTSAPAPTLTESELPTAPTTTSTFNPTTTPATNSMGDQLASLLSGLNTPADISFGNISLPAPDLNFSSPGSCNSCGNTDPLAKYAPNQAPAVSTPPVASGLFAQITNSKGQLIASGTTAPASSSSNSASALAAFNSQNQYKIEL